jgi:hypothetical protein
MPVVSSQKHLFEKPFHYTQLGMVSAINGYYFIRLIRKANARRNRRRQLFTFLMREGRKTPSYAVC